MTLTDLLWVPWQMILKLGCRVCRTLSCRAQGQELCRGGGKRKWRSSHAEARKVRQTLARLSGVQQGACSHSSSCWMSTLGVCDLQARSMCYFCWESPPSVKLEAKGQGGAAVGPSWSLWVLVCLCSLLLHARLFSFTCCSADLSPTPDTEATSPHRYVTHSHHACGQILQ